MSVAHQRGARAERGAAQLLGGVRTGNLGRAAADVRIGDWCVVEVKERARLPGWILGALRQAETAAAGCITRPLPIALLHELGGRRADDLVVMRAADFRDWYGELQAGEGAPDGA